MSKELSLLLLLIFTVRVLGDLKLTILHVNDLHSHFEEISATIGTCHVADKCYGGFARLKKVVDQIKAEQKGEREVIFLNAGDNFQGTPYFTIFKWPVVADLVNRLNFDVMCLGNHEFDNSPTGLAPYLNETNAVSVAANLDLTDEPILKVPRLKPYHVLEVNGTKIGVIGYVTPNTTFLSNTGKVKFLDEIYSINTQITKLKEEGVSIFIGLGHSGYNVDLDIAMRVPDIDIIVGGHSNTFLYNGSPPDLEIPVDVYPKVVTQDSKKQVPVVQAYAYSKYLGNLQVDFNSKGELTHFEGNPILLNATYGQDESVLQAVESWKKELEGVSSRVLGKTLVFLDAHSHACKLGECNLGNLIVDAMIEINARSYEGDDGWTDAPIAFYQAGGIRASIDSREKGGNITYGDILTVLPMKGMLVKGKIKGIYLRQALEFSVHRYERTNLEQVGEFLQASGILVKYDISADPGSRVVSAKTRCGKCIVPKYSGLDDAEEYTIILPQFLAGGGDNYQVFKDNLYDIEEINITDTDAVAEYIRIKSPVFPGIKNRIQLINIQEPTTTQTTTSQPITTQPITTQPQLPSSTAQHVITNDTTSSPVPTTQAKADSLKYVTSLFIFATVNFFTQI